jgi:predicted Zn-dependent protease
MTSGPGRVAALEELREKDPANTLTLLMLANEYSKLARWSDAIAVLRDYLARADDEGAAYRLLGNALRESGDEDAARTAFLQGAEAARRHRHDGMAAELEAAAHQS